MKLGPLRLFHILEISYDGDIESRMLQRRITRDRHKESKVRQELCRANQYEKPRQDAGVFYYLDFLNQRRVCRPGYELKSLKITSINIEKIIKCDMFHSLFFSSKIFL